MKQRTFNYSLKNIPIPPAKLYKKRLLEKIENVTKRMKWKAHFPEKGEKSNEKKENCGLKSRMCSPPVKEMENFENALIEMAQNVEFREVNNSFQRELKKDMKDVKSSNKAFIPADKTRNIYEMDKQTHNKLLHENITKTYKKNQRNRLLRNQQRSQKDSNKARN